MESEQEGAEWGLGLARQGREWRELTEELDALASRWKMAVSLTPQSGTSLATPVEVIADDADAETGADGGETRCNTTTESLETGRSCRGAFRSREDSNADLSAAQHSKDQALSSW